MMLVALLGVLAVGVGAYAAFGAPAVATPTITSGPANPTNVTSASFTFTDADAVTKFQCSLDTASFVDCGTVKPSSKSYAGLAQGSHTFKVHAVSTKGTSSDASYTWTIDTTPPAAPGISTKPTNPSDNPNPSFGFTASEPGESFLCSLDGASSFTACSNPVSYSNLAAGSHTFQVKGKDQAGNVSSSPSSYTWTVVLPAPTITAKPANPTNQTSASFSFTDTRAGVSFECSLDGAAFAACSSPKSYPGPLSEGTHSFQVRAASGTARSAATSYSWRIDTSPPAITVTFPSNGGAYNATAWNAGCSGGAGICGSATDPSGVAGAAVSIQQQATGKWWNGTAFATSSESFNPVSQVGGSGTTWTGRYPLPVPPNGSYLVHVRAADSLGNTNTAANQTSLTFTIGTVGPSAPMIADHPANPTSADTATFTLIGTPAGVSFLCKLDTGSYSACVSGITYTGLSNASHTFSVEAKDGAGNLSSPATFIWTIVAGAPFTMTGNAVGSLYPGGPAQPVNIAYTNPADVAITITTTSVSVSSVTPVGANVCNSGDFSSPHGLLVTVVIPANSTRSLSQLVADQSNWPSIRMADNGNQNGCKNASINLSYAGNAHS